MTLKQFQSAVAYQRMLMHENADQRWLRYRRLDRQRQEKVAR